MSPAVVLALVVAAADEGRPLHYWGAQPPVIVPEPAGGGRGDGAEVTEIHAARGEEGLVLRFTLDRPVREAIRLPDGTPVSGRLQAVLYLDADDERATGLASGEMDLRTGADLRLEVGSLSMGEDPEEERPAEALVTAALFALTPAGRRRTLWRADTEAQPESVSARGEWVEVRLPPEPHVAPRARLVYVAAGRAWAGRLER